MRETPRRRSFGPAQATSGKLLTALSIRGEEVVPSILRWQYSTNEYVPSVTGQNRLAVVGLADQFPSQEDLTTFMDNFAGHAQASNLHCCTGEWRRERPEQPRRAGERRDSVRRGHGVPDPTHLLQHRRRLGGGTRPHARRW
jgi:hypothetical protein